MVHFVAAIVPIHSYCPVEASKSKHSEITCFSILLI